MQCDLCGFATDNDEDVISFGSWMKRQGITVHYFCLLLSTNLPQRGEDTNGILGFLVRDIRLEIRDAQARKCIYCYKMRASIACFKCKNYFHLVCGHNYDCAFQFTGDFRSYCDKCLPLDECQQHNKNNPPVGERCFICMEPMGKYNPITWIYGRCCKNGYVHRLCLRKYALAAGYYLICIWCRSKAFRNKIRLQGIFVPDRDAQWEQKNAYAELHRGHESCNMVVCNCPKGRDYIRGYWTIIVCSLCGSFGAHNPGCIPGKGGKRQKEKVKSFKCDTCQRTLESVANRTAMQNEESALRVSSPDFVVDYQLQMNKMPRVEAINQASPLNDTPQFSFSDEESISLSSSATTVRARQFNSISVPIVEQENNTVAESDEYMQVDDESPNVTVISLEESTQEFEIERNHTPTECIAEGEEVLPVNSEEESSIKIDNIAMEPTTAADLIYIVEDWPDFDDQFNVLSTCKVRIDLNGERFQGQTINDICSFEGMNLITDADKFERTSCTGIFKTIDDIIAQSSKEFEKESTVVEDLEKTRESFKALNISCTNNKSIAQQQKSKTSNNEEIFEQERNSSDVAKTVSVIEQLERTQPEAEVQETSYVTNTQKSSIDCFDTTLESSAGAVHQMYILEDWPEFDDQFNVLSTCKVRFDLSGPHFQGKTIDDICSFEGMSWITEADKFGRSSGPGIWKQVDEMFVETLVLFEKESNNRAALEKAVEVIKDNFSGVQI